MVITAIKLKINGIEVKAPKIGGITRKSEKVWSKNTGRSATGRMQGTILSIKRTLSISWPPMTQGEQELIESVVSNTKIPFATLEITRPNGNVESIECYFGTPSFDEWDLIGGIWRCTNGKVDAIER